MVATLSSFTLGDKVIICAADAFYAYVDGWRGVVTGYNNGSIEVTCQRPDGRKVLYIDPGQLSHTV
ncbi:hypothetical protein [Acidovorax delafieldii]|uniref:hypothetical protein n=1 Tax=Acidovorax delafieldii TaxID=47920 RepID=UPI003ED15BB0